MNDIPAKQNSEPFLRLLRARSRVYDEAVRLQVMQLILTVAVPILTGFAGVFWEPIRPYVAIGALLIAIFDVAALDRMQRQKIKVAAKISECFDCALFDLDWNNFAIGKKVDPELIDAAARAYKGDMEKLINWYPTSVRKAPLHIATIVCQRTNLWYDSQLRRRFATMLVVCLVLLLLSLAIFGLVTGLNLLGFVATVLVPAAPVLIWAIRENFRQRDAAEAIENQKSEAESLFESLMAGSCDEATCRGRSREFQDAIYARRSSNPLVFPIIYRIYRPEMEKQMTAGAEEFMSKLRV